MNTYAIGSKWKSNLGAVVEVVGARSPYGRTQMCKVLEAGATNVTVRDIDLASGSWKPFVESTVKVGDWFRNTRQPKLVVEAVKPPATPFLSNWTCKVVKGYSFYKTGDTEYCPLGDTAYWTPIAAYWTPIAAEPAAPAPFKVGDKVIVAGQMATISKIENVQRYSFSDSGDCAYTGQIRPAPVPCFIKYNLQPGQHVKDVRTSGAVYALETRVLAGDRVNYTWFAKGISGVLGGEYRLEERFLFPVPVVKVNPPAVFKFKVGDEVRSKMFPEDTYTIASLHKCGEGPRAGATLGRIDTYMMYGNCGFDYESNYTLVAPKRAVQVGEVYTHPKWMRGQIQVTGLIHGSSLVPCLVIQTIVKRRPSDRKGKNFGETGCWQVRDPAYKLVPAHEVAKTSALPPRASRTWSL